MKIFFRTYLAFFSIYGISTLWIFVDIWKAFGFVSAFNGIFSSLLVLLVGLFACIRKKIWVVGLLFLYGLYLLMNIPYMMRDPISTFISAIQHFNFQPAMSIFVYYFMAIISAVGLVIWWRERSKQ